MLLDRKQILDKGSHWPVALNVTSVKFCENQLSGFRDNHNE